jgi:hypothetical protein
MPQASFGPAAYAARVALTADLLYYPHPQPVRRLWERALFTLLLILLIFGITLGVILFAGGLFIQGYIYTEPSPNLPWTAPVAGAVLFFFYAMWCLVVALGMTNPNETPYHVVWQFSPNVSRLGEPAKELTAVRKGGKTDQYVLKKTVYIRGMARPAYRSKLTDQPWNDSGVEAVVLKLDDGEVRFDLVSEKRREQGANREFISSDGWVMKDFGDGPTGLPVKFRFFRLMLFFFLHAFHLALWFACLWLLMRFQWSHALAGAFVIWLAFTVIVLPMLLDYAEVARARRVPPAAAHHGPLAPQEDCHRLAARDVSIHGGSYPPALNGLQRQMRHTPLHPPLIGPCLCTARMKYSLQLG